MADHPPGRGEAKRLVAARRTRRAVAVVALGACVLVAGAGAAPGGRSRLKTPARASEPHLGTTFELAVVPPAGWERARVGEALGAAWAELRRLDGLVSHLPDSDVGRVNAAAGSSSVVVGEETFSLVRRCLEYAEFSGGVFDVTYAALSPLWRFDPGQPGAVPDAREVARLRKLVDYRKVVLDEPRRAVMLPAAGMRMGLGGIARGYAVDRVARVLEGQGLASVAVRAGSATLVAGPWPEDQRKVALLDPRAPSQVMAWVEVKSGAVSVVRDDERAFVAAGKRYHPVIDPRTGYPARASRLAAVLARTATDAEWLARTVFIRGLAESTRALASVAGAEALVVTEQNVVDMTPGMRRHVTVVADPTPGDP